jgi:4-aminobutyrate aminotransferase-like enzyme/Ser/Thr protein kinase RdoA (MazF antagonist)
MAPLELEVSPRPAVGTALAARLAQDLFGVSGEVDELGSHQDRNFRIRAETGPVVLKVANRSWGRPALEAQNAALRHIAAAGAGFGAPLPLAGASGDDLHMVDLDGEAVPVRMLTFVEGSPLAEHDHLSPELVADLGRLAARTSDALAGFDHPGLDRTVQWDLRIAADVVASLLGSVADPARQALVADRTAAAGERLTGVADALRVQAIHGDVTDDNVVGRRDEAGRVRPDGVIDFGDLTRSWLVADLAVTCASVLRHLPDDPFAVLPAIVAFDEVVPLDDADLAALWPLIVLRGAVLVTSGEHQSMLDPDNESATGPLESEWRIFHTARAVPFDLAEATVRAALGRGPAPRHAAALSALAGAGRLFPQAPEPVVVDLSVTSDVLASGRFLAPTVEADVLREAAGSNGTAVTGHGEARLTRTRLDSAEAPATVALGLDLVVPAGTLAVAPWQLTVASTVGSTVVADGPAGRLTVRGLVELPAEGSAVAAGAPLGRAGGGEIRIQLCVEPSLEPPHLAARPEADGWLLLCPDPSPLIGVDVTGEEPSSADLLRRRDASFARVQEHYYREPVRIERGWRHHLVDTEGRAYIDMVNNVAAIGHGHPRLAEAVHRQMLTLNTNSRFHYAAVAELSERLASLCPDGLDTVFLVNSGSEAVDLALRIAQTVTDRLDVVAVREAYHGWTMLSDAVTTSLYDNPTALENRPDWVHLASAPNTYRGRFRGPTAGDDYALELRELVERIASEGRPPAAFICEPVFGNAGGVLLPEGYLAHAYDAVRSVGGLCIADEVQVGYGRLGHHWWAYEMHGVRPDIITVAKAMGNGHPLGAVITSRAVADAFAAQGSFFSSAGGSPVSCVVGLTVLDVIEDEQLQANAARVGDHLLGRLEELRRRHPLIGAVHGMGLYLGVELVRDHETREPATAECYAICERLLELGVVVQPTGERANVLKMKPPMCLTRASADVVVDQLDRVLREGW